MSPHDASSLDVSKRISNGAAEPCGPTVVDRAFQLSYTVAYRLMRTYWRVKRPVTHGALVALWHDGEVLLVRNSYVPYYSAPGGYVRRDEESRHAAVRELAEEVDLHVDPEALTLALDVTHEWEYKQDHVHIFELTLSERPQIHVDHREVIDATWFSPERAMALNVFPPLKTVIAQRLRS
jgi:8-oxo-dGTP pyrophosphatase MutT (NUDIX family)